MNDQEQAHWHAWCKAIARAEAVKAAVEMNDLLVDDLDKFHNALAERFDQRKAYFEKQNADLRAEFETLKTTVAELASEIRDLWAAVEGNGDVVSRAARPGSAAHAL
jgi:hypothetical protein